MNRLFLALALTTLAGCTTIQPGHIGVQVYYGALQQDTLEPGMYWSPLTAIWPMSTRYKPQGLSQAPPPTTFRT